MNELTEKRPGVTGCNVTIENRERISLSGIVRMDSFDDGEVSARCESSSVTVFGQGLHITRLDLDNGILIVDGFIAGVEYADAENRGSLFSRLFK